MQVGRVMLARNLPSYLCRSPIATFSTNLVLYGQFGDTNTNKYNYNYRVCVDKDEVFQKITLSCLGQLSVATSTPVILQNDWSIISMGPARTIKSINTKCTVSVNEHSYFFMLANLRLLELVYAWDVPRDMQMFFRR
jgi:hypothetical protein